MNYRWKPDSCGCLTFALLYSNTLHRRTYWEKYRIILLFSQNDAFLSLWVVISPAPSICISAFLTSVSRQWAVRNRNKSSGFNIINRTFFLQVRALLWSVCALIWRFQHKLQLSPPLSSSIFISLRLDKIALTWWRATFSQNCMLQHTSAL